MISATGTAPKDSTSALLLEGKTHLLRLLKEIPLGKAEQAAPKMVLQPTKISRRNWPTCPLRRANTASDSAQNWYILRRADRCDASCTGRWCKSSQLIPPGMTTSCAREYGFPFLQEIVRSEEHTSELQ